MTINILNYSCLPNDRYHTDKSNWEAMTTLEFLSQDAAARMAYDARMKALSDEKSRIESALLEGEARGETRGKAETASKLLALGVDMQTIVEATGLSTEEIKALSPLQ